MSKSMLVSSPKPAIASVETKTWRKAFKYALISVVLFYGIGVPATIISAGKSSPDLQATIQECDVPALKWLLEVIF